MIHTLRIPCAHVLTTEEAAWVSSAASAGDTCGAPIEVEITQNILGLWEYDYEQQEDTCPFDHIMVGEELDTFIAYTNTMAMTYNEYDLDDEEDDEDESPN